MKDLIRLWRECERETEKERTVNTWRDDKKSPTVFKLTFSDFINWLEKQHEEEHKHVWRTLAIRQREFVDWLPTAPFETRVELQKCDCCGY